MNGKPAFYHLKNNKKILSQYRVIDLLNTTLKLTDEQQGLRSGKSCTNMIFEIEQIIENCVEYNRPEYMWFIDQTKALGCIKLLLHYDRQISHSLFKIIENTCTQQTKFKLEYTYKTNTRNNRDSRRGTP